MGHVESYEGENMATSDTTDFPSPTCLLSRVLNATYRGGLEDDHDYLKSFLAPRYGGTASLEDREAVSEVSSACGTIFDGKPSFR